MLVKFAKYQSTGNDFIILDAVNDYMLRELAENPSSINPLAIKRLCDRHIGIGADGVLVISPRTSAERAENNDLGVVARMTIYNADGSPAEMCGNGLRCVALHLASKFFIGKSVARMVIATLAGPKPCTVHFDTSSHEAIVGADLGVVAKPVRTKTKVHGRKAKLYSTSVGNPHCIMLDPPPRLLFDRDAATLSKHWLFPDGANVSFATVTDSNALEVRVWERGVGPTMACGSAACAVAAVATHAGIVRAGDEVIIRMPGGTLHVTISENGHARLVGSVSCVFTGTFHCADLKSL